MKKVIKEVIFSIKNEPKRWKKNEYTLDRDDGVQVWTANVPYINCSMYRPAVQTGFLEGIYLQIAVNNFLKNMSLSDCIGFEK